MALKAGYVGVKRWLYEKLQATAAKNVQDIADIWTYNTKSGAINKLKITAATTTVTDATFTISTDGSVSINSTGAIAANRDLNLSTTLSLKEGDKIKIGFADANTDKVRMTIYNNSTPAQVANSFGAPVQYTAQSTGNYTVYIRAISGKSFDNYTIKPMVYDAIIPDPEFASYAMTNRQLTKLNTLKTVNYDDTTVNASISAVGYGIYKKYGEVNQVSGKFTTSASISAWSNLFKIPGAANMTNSVTVALYDHTDPTKSGIYKGDVHSEYVRISLDLTALHQYSFDMVYLSDSQAIPSNRSAAPEIIEDDPEPVTKTTRSTKKTTTIKEGE